MNAYALGCTDEGLRKELTAMKKSGVEIEALQSYGGGTSLKSKIFSEEVILFYFFHFHLSIETQFNRYGFSLRIKN